MAEKSDHVRAPRARFVSEESSGQGWRCGLCPHFCLWSDPPDGSRLGLCRIRGLDGSGVPSALGYGECVSLAIDPIEKKPLYHFHPGSDVLSTGPAGCNLSCSFCQNWGISQSDSAGVRFVEPPVLAEFALSEGSSGVAFTYTEPTIWFEYIADVSPLVRDRGGYVVMVSNGFVNPGPLNELLELTDAWNIDLKAWSDDFYSRLCGGDRRAVMRSLEQVAASRCHLEVTFLVIPGENDDPREWEQMGRWLAEHAGSGTPLHISRYFPRYRLRRPPTPQDVLRKAEEVFGRHLDHVYLGNVPGGSRTLCPECGSVLVNRGGYHGANTSGLTDAGMCSSCGAATGIVVGSPDD